MGVLFQHFLSWEALKKHEMVNVLFEAGAEVQFDVIRLAIRDRDRYLIALLVDSSDETTCSQWIGEGILEIVICQLETDYVVEIVKKIARPAAVEL